MVMGAGRISITIYQIGGRRWTADPQSGASLISSGLLGHELEAGTRPAAMSAIIKSSATAWTKLLPIGSAKMTVSGGPSAGYSDNLLRRNQRERPPKIPDRRSNTSNFERSVAGR